MLTHLTIQHFATVDELDIEFAAGMTAVTGETGAGKSVLLGALDLALGQRADANCIAPGASQADITAAFDCDDAARAWLADHDLTGAEGECLLRRVITREGRSRAFINGRVVTLANLRELAGLLIDLHTQHAHQALTRSDDQRKLLDAFAGSAKLADEVTRLADKHRELSRRIQELTAQRDNDSAETQLLQYQLDELEALELQENELDALEKEQKLLANADEQIAGDQQALQLLRDDDGSALELLRQVRSVLRKNPAQDTAIDELLADAEVYLDEAADTLATRAERTELDPQRLQTVEQRLDIIHSIARKHRIPARELPALEAGLRDKLSLSANCGETIAALELEINALAEAYDKQCATLSGKRRRAGKKLAKAVITLLEELGMKHCDFAVDLKAREAGQFHSDGMESIGFLLRTNPGADMAPLARIASGGELSRISLTIHVVTAGVIAVPTIIFDEIDVGIGGATAEIVGKFLHQLAKQTQVLCITHQAQVASQADHHIKVCKSTDKKRARTRLDRLVEDAKIEEIARMLGGVAITQSTLAHAEEMLQRRH